MEYVDGEGTPAARAAIDAHLASCGACQALVADQQRLAGTMQAWRVPSAPESLQPPQSRPARAWWRPSRGIAAGLAAAAVVLVAVAIQQRQRTPDVGKSMAISLGARETSASIPAPASGPIDALRSTRPAAQALGARGGVPEAVEAVPQRPGPGPSIIRTARLHIVTKDFSVARESVESIVSGADGFLDQLTVTGDTTKARVVRGTVRVPSQRMTDVLTSLRRLGTVLEDTQGAQDVTEQIVDLDARRTNARATEQRLTDILRNRTGRLSDVLEIEREVARVRLEIERLDAERTNLSRRVSYATIDVTISEERKESLDGPVSLATRLRIAALDGIEAALDTVAGIVLFTLRAGPTLVFWGTLAGLGWLLVRRRFRDSPTPTASE